MENRHTQQQARALARIGALANIIQPVATCQQLVLPDAQRATLRLMVAGVRQQARIYEDWQFCKVRPHGQGWVALFAGSSGTGKSLAAEVIAHELGMCLCCVDLSAVVSKYIGETEKNLQRIFEAAQEAQAMLLFDEGDALFGKRSDVKDSHDRYANIEVSYLLQALEQYSGLAILTTNLADAVDVAFKRRIQFFVEFPFPDAVQRAAIWPLMIPPNAPVEDGLSLSHLAQLNVTGGNIRNIALVAAVAAAEANERIGMRHMLLGARAEYAKLGKVLTGAELAGWEI